jgi:hypothetical protein
VNETTWFRIVLDQILFYELADDSIVDLDAANRQMEVMVEALRSLPVDERHRFVAYAHAMAAKTRDPKRADFLRTIDESLDLTS